MEYFFKANEAEHLFSQTKVLPDKLLQMYKEINSSQSNFHVHVLLYINQIIRHATHVYVVISLSCTIYATAIWRRL